MQNEKVLEVEEMFEELIAKVREIEDFLKNEREMRDKREQYFLDLLDFLIKDYDIESKLTPEQREKFRSIVQALGWHI